MKKIHIKIAVFIIPLLIVTTISFSQTVNTYNFNYQNTATGRFKLITIDELNDSLSYSRDSIILLDTTMLETVSFYSVSNRHGKNLSDNSSSTFTVHPNPFTKIFEIEYESNVEENGKIKILDVLGRNIINEIHSIQIGTNHLEIDLSSYKSGIYFVTITAGNYVATKRVVKH